MTMTGLLSSTAAMMVKDCVNHAYEPPLSEGIHFERRIFQAMFATLDQKEGMAAFVEKPDAARAEKFLAEGGYCWNSGMFLSM